MIQQEPMWLYRFEAIDPLNGLWYNDTGEWVYDSGIGQLDNNPAKSLPMDYDPRYTKDNRIWHSAGKDKTAMQYWFCHEDVEKLIHNGFVLYRYLATEYIHYEHETCFIKETSLTRELLNPYEIFDQKGVQ